MAGAARRRMIEVSEGFPPVCEASARLLVLGSLPGVRSLQQRQYYAQPRNAFWRIMGEICGAFPQLSYGERLKRLRASGIALWDVLAAAERPGSLDSRIRRASMKVNDFEPFLGAHPRIGLICFNGRTAADMFARHVTPTLSVPAPRAVVLPSTSPAHAGMPYEEKLRLWRAQLESVVGAP